MPLVGCRNVQGSWKKLAVYTAVNVVLKRVDENKRKQMNANLKVTENKG